MALDPGKLRHRVRIEELISPVDSNGDPLRGEQGELIGKVWTPIANPMVWASIEPLSVRDFIQSAVTQSEVSARIEMRYRPGLHDGMRFVHVRNGIDAAIYNPAGGLPDRDSGLEYITFPVKQGVNTGE